ncbi:MAG TPA: hypothetical protein VN851_14485 [Thermoanaerobaculia bacterium]|nr:hypothetical protein [Thermoanaerobaculia bacterium]
MKRLLELVRSACYSWSGNKRDLEGALGIGHGRLEEILDGQPELRVRHIVSLARLLKVRPSDFLRLAYSDEESTATQRLEDWVGEPKPPNARRKPQPLAPEHEQQIRELIRDELAKREK